MSENNSVQNENTPEENENVNWPTFDYNEKNWPANRLYVSEVPVNATPGVRPRRDDSQELYLKFDWYFSTSESVIESKEFTIPMSSRKFIFRALSSQWREHGKHIEVWLGIADDSRQKVGVEFTVKLRSPNWKIIDELRGGQEFSYERKFIDLFSVKGKPVDIWPVDPTTELIADMDLIPRVYAIKGTLRFMAGGTRSWKVGSRGKDGDLMKLDTPN